METISVETKVQSVADFVMDYTELMTSEPAWAAHAYMVEYSDATNLYCKALCFLKEMTPNIKQEYLDFKIILDDIEKSSPFDWIYLEKESEKMRVLLERLIGELAIIGIYLQKSEANSKGKE